MIPRSRWSRAQPALGAALAVGIVVVFAGIGHAQAPEEVPLRDIRGPLDIQTLRGWLIRAALVIGPLLLLALGWWWYRRNGASTPEAIRVTAADRARERLREAWAFIETPEKFCTYLSEVVRVYLEERFGLHAPDRTTEEFLTELSASPVLDRRHCDLVGTFLQHCDLVKFARADAGRTELEQLHASAAQLVDETGLERPDIGETTGGRR
jgi:hypothetical protein